MSTLTKCRTRWILCCVTALALAGPVFADMLKVVAGATFVTKDGAVRVVGYNDMQELMASWTAAFERQHPNVRLALDLKGTRFAPEALADGTSAFAPMGAEFTPPQLAEYRKLNKHDPVAFRVAHASLDARALSGPLAILVHRDNPLTSISMQNLARIYGGNAKRWGDVGATGASATREIRLYGLERGTALAYFFQARVLASRDLPTNMNGSRQSAEVVNKVALDPLAIGFAGANRADNKAVRALALASEGEPPTDLTEENVGSGRYPLDRHLLIYAQQPLSPIARAFLRIALSDDGQRAVTLTPQRYMPLSPSELTAERKKLEAS